MDLNSVKSVHFIGIGGIGISAIARMLLLEGLSSPEGRAGKKVTGSDRSSSRVTEELIANGAEIYIGHKAGQIADDCDLVVYTIAIPESNPEIVEAKERGLTMMTYPQMLNLVSHEKYTIAVSGTHGKTTTTAMIAKILIDAGLDPTVVVGSILLEQGTNFVPGKSKFLVVEADEYRNSFFNLSPTILVINNIDLDHLDFFRGLGDIQRSFRTVAESVPGDGYVVCNMSDPHVLPVVNNLRCRVVDYAEFKSDGLKLQIPGNHNRSNVAAARAVASVLNVDKVSTVKSLEEFRGTWRRFEYKGKTKFGALVYDDYAHNPQKVRAALQGAREMFPDKTITAIFQPHLYSRTKLLLNEFAESFADIDELILLPIYAAREAEDKTISSEILANEISKAKTAFVATFPDDREQTKAGFGIARLRGVSVAHNQDDAISLIPKNADVVITIGAGDVTEISTMLTR